MGVTMHDTTRRRGSAEVQTLGGPAELLWPRSLWRDILYEHLYTTCIRPQKKKDWKYICGVYFWVWDLMAILLNVKKKTFYFPHILFSSVQFSRSVMSDSATLWTAARQVSLSITKSQSLLKLMSIELMMPSNHLILCHHLLLLSSSFPSSGS